MCVSKWRQFSNISFFEKYQRNATNERKPKAHKQLTLNREEWSWKNKNSFDAKEKNRIRNIYMCTRFFLALNRLFACLIVFSSK